ncbi:hypothetical protein [Cereibacter changlensis]|uniref:hypothetical protein n=1 Tax=Cereibacter changlensis TaxID=402884 RepID=UPI004034A165
MAKFHGEITIDNGMKMVMDYNCLCELESITGKPAMDVLAGFEKGNARMTDLRAFYYACLLRHQPEMTVQDAGDIAAEYPEALVQIIESATPASPKSDAVGNVKPTRFPKR